MRFLFALLVCVFPIMSFGQGLKLTSMTTNLTMNQPSAGNVPIWNGTANRWSNGTLTATATNIPDYVLTNRWNGPTLTNRVALRQEGAMEALGAVLATNGALIFGQDAFPITFGGNNDFVTGHAMTNWYNLNQRGNITLEVPGAGIDVYTGAQIRQRTGSILQIDSGSRLELDYLTANRVMITGGGSMATNHPDMRLGASLSGAADGEVLGYHAASGTWTNQAAGTGTPAGNNFEIQYKDNGVFAASTNILVSTNKSDPKIIIGTPAMSSTVAGLEIRGVNNTNQVTQHGMSATDSTLNVGVSNGVYIVQFNILNGRLNLAASAGGGLGSVINGAWHLIQATNLFADSTIHTPGASTAGSLSVSNALGPPSFIRLSETNNTFTHTIQAATQMSRSSTNIPGVFEASAASVLELNTRQQHKLTVTNRMAANSTLVVTNSVPGEEYSVVLIGAVAGGTDYTCTYVPHTGQLARNLDGTNNTPATSISISVPAGSSVEINSATRFGVGTNWHDVVTRKGLGS